MVNSYGNGNQRPSRSIRKVNEGQIKVQFNDDYSTRLEYEDKLPEGMTEEDVKEKYAKLVWCEFTDCFWNQREKDLQVTWGKVTGNKSFSPITPHEMVWNGICSRPNEIVLKFKAVRDHTGGRVKVPYCYTAAANGKTGHVDFAKLLQGDGTPYGGNIDSQAAADMSYGIPNSWGGRERIVSYGTSSKHNRSSDHTIGE